MHQVIKAGCVICGIWNAWWNSMDWGSVMVTHLDGDDWGVGSGEECLRFCAWWCNKILWQRQLKKERLYLSQRLRVWSIVAWKSRQQEQEGWSYHMASTVRRTSAVKACAQHRFSFHTSKSRISTRKRGLPQWVRCITSINTIKRIPRRNAWLPVYQVIVGSVQLTVNVNTKDNV